MRLTLRFVIPLALTLAAIAYAVIPLVDRLTLRWFLHDVDIRVELILNTIQEPLYEAFKDSGSRGGRAQLQRFLGRILQDEGPYAGGFCGVQGERVFQSP